MQQLHHGVFVAFNLHRPIRLMLSHTVLVLAHTYDYNVYIASTSKQDECMLKACLCAGASIVRHYIL